MRHGWKAGETVRSNTNTWYLSTSATAWLEKLFKKSPIYSLHSLTFHTAHNYIYQLRQTRSKWTWESRINGTWEYNIKDTWPEVEEPRVIHPELCCQIPCYRYLLSHLIVQHSPTSHHHIYATLKKTPISQIPLTKDTLSSLGRTRWTFL